MYALHYRCATSKQITKTIHSPADKIHASNVSPFSVAGESELMYRVTSRSEVRACTLQPNEGNGPLRDVQCTNILCFRTDANYTSRSSMYNVEGGAWTLVSWSIYVAEIA